MRERSKKPGLVFILIIMLIIAGGTIWFVMGKNRIMRAIPDSVKIGERVILISPKATPTSEFEPTPTLTEEEQAELDKQAEEAPTNTPAPTAEKEPTSKPTNDPTGTPTPTPEE